ncbi:AurF N-oxygenase family protein [Actinomadura macrotermitis]|nr:diiron oxygenase [Actinomadura macrotermitis]
MTVRLAGRGPGRPEDHEVYLAMIDRLNKASVNKHCEAYVDIPWDDPRFQIDPDDPRWVLPPFDRLSETAWYRSQSREVQARIGLWRLAASYKTGMQFENLLKQGLLSFAYRLPNGSPEFRYLYHETAEECQHGMMFQEFVNRTGMPVGGMPRIFSLIGQLARWAPLVSPELFFMFVLGGEEPIDYMQRKMLREKWIEHPLAETIFRLHVAEEARHISFAQHYLRYRVPQMSRAEREVFGLVTPFVLATVARIMLFPPGTMVRYFGIPRPVVRAAYHNAATRTEICASLGRTRDLVFSLGLITPVNTPAWKVLGIWDAPRGRRAGSPAPATGGGAV